MRDADAWLQALRTWRPPPGDGFAWCATEARIAAQARDILLSGHGHPREALRVAAYWKRGDAAFHQRLDD